MMNYTFNIKDFWDSLDYINFATDDDKMVQICLIGLAHKYDTFPIAITTRENSSNVIGLQSILGPY